MRTSGLVIRKAVCSGIWKLGVVATIGVLLTLGGISSLQTSSAKQEGGSGPQSGAAMAQAGTKAVEAIKETRGVDAIQGIVAAFKAHPVVAIGEDHWLLQAGAFYIELARNKEFQETVQDIVVEFASRNNQALLDKYVSGTDVSQADLQRTWRDTTKAASWESPMYARWLAVIRQVNQGLPPARRLRVLAGDTAIDWSQIHTHDDWAALGDNNASFADVITKEVLAKKRRAFVVLGTGHVARGNGGSENNGTEAGNATARVESRYPGSVFVVLLNCWGLVTSDAQSEIDSSHPSVPSLYALEGTPLGKTVDRRGAPLASRGDAFLYLGPPSSFTMAFPAPGSLDPAYLKEIDRRSMIEWGELRARKFLGPAGN